MEMPLSDCVNSETYQSLMFYRLVKRRSLYKKLEQESGRSEQLKNDWAAFDRCSAAEWAK